jgi:hypothetical protein
MLMLQDAEDESEQIGVAFSFYLTDHRRLTRAHMACAYRRRYGLTEFPDANFGMKRRGTGPFDHALKTTSPGERSG